MIEGKKRWIVILAENKNASENLVSFDTQMTQMIWCDIVWRDYDDILDVNDDLFALLHF